MPHIAIKRLSHSDLSFFATHVRDSKQKAINLNGDVFIDEFFPGMPDYAEQHLALYLFGPGGAPAHELSRKVIRSAGSKNWRLNGEVVADPLDQPGRYDSLSPDDFAVMSFEGTDRPSEIRLLLITKKSDAELHDAIAGLLPGARSMAVLSQADVERLAATFPETFLNPELGLSLGFDSPIDALLGTAADQSATARGNGLGARIGQSDVRRQSDQAAESGQRGEELFAEWLRVTGHSSTDWEWISRQYARAAFDFRVRRAKWAGDTDLFIDVKASRSSNPTSFHMSSAEVLFAADRPNYGIAAVAGVFESEIRIRIYDGVATVAAELRKHCQGLPAGVTIDSFAISLSRLTMTHAVECSLSDLMTSQDTADE